MTSKRPKLNLNNSSSSSSVHDGALISASSKISRSDTQDINQVAVFLESLNAWLNGYFFSRLALNCSQLPQTPRFENTELQDVCETLRSTVGIVREQAIKKINKEVKPDRKKQNIACELRGLNTDNDEKKIHMLLDNTLKDAKQKGFSLNVFKQTLYDKCEVVCSCLQLAISETRKNKPREVEGLTDFSKTKRNEEYSILNKSRQESDLNIIRVVYPLVARVKNLQEKKQFYSLLFRHYEKFIKHEEGEIKKILDSSKPRPKRKIKIKSVFLSIFAATCIKNLLLEDEKINLKGLKVKLLDTSLLPNKTVTIKSLPGIISSIQNSVGTTAKQRSTLNSLISCSISVFQKFMNDVKAVLTALMKNNLEQKEVVQALTDNLKKLELERDELEGELTRNFEYTKNLEIEIMQMTGDSEYLRLVGEETDKSLELESHKRALKGLTSQYNQLEHKMDLIKRDYDELKKEYFLKVKRLEEIEGRKKG